MQMITNEKVLQPQRIFLSIIWKEIKNSIYMLEANLILNSRIQKTVGKTSKERHKVTFVYVV